MLAIVIGLIPALLLRFLVFRRPVGIWAAIGLSFVILVGLSAIYRALGTPHPQLVGASSAISLWILWAGLSRSKSSAAANRDRAGRGYARRHRPGGTTPVVDLAQPREQAEGTQVDRSPAEPVQRTALEHRLTDLKALHDRGLITASDYDAKKAKLLDEL
jgi:hypothetical protein